jgi:uncharacterized protein DUF5681
MTMKPPAAATAGPTTAPKQRGKPFQKGKSGNPKGRRPGTRHRMTVLAEQLMSDDVEAVVKKIVRRAKAGDMSAAKLILDRILPVRKGRPVQFPLPAISSPAAVIEALSAIIEAVGRGDLTPDEAGQLSTVVELQRSALETLALAARVARLEQVTAQHDY